MIAEMWVWITDLTNSKILALLIFFTTFVGILIYVYSNKKRSERFESYRYVPLMDDDDDPRLPTQAKAATTQSVEGEK